MSDDQELLFANAAFYAAFADGDLALMDRLWARSVRVACVHPGWEPLVGRDTVMESWRAILAAPPDIECTDPDVFVYGETGFVICRESANGNPLVATNVFVREDGDWRLVHHQAGPAPEPSGDSPTHPVH